MRSIVAVVARSCLVAFLILTLLTLPVIAGSAKPLGVVVTAENAHLDNAGAVSGAAVYSGDALATDTGGSLRLRIARSQMYLRSSTAATLLQQENNKVQANVDRGTLGFSMPAPGELEIGTPLGIIRAANGQNAFGQVVILSRTRMQVSAYEGTLVVAAGAGPEKMIGPGETYEGTLAAGPGSPDDVGPKGAGSEGINWKRVLPALIVGGGAAIAAAVIWHEMTESCSVPSKCD